MILCQKQNISLQAMVCITVRYCVRNKIFLCKPWFVLQYDTVSETKYFFASHDGLYYSMILCQKQNISLQAMVCITV